MKSRWVYPAILIAVFVGVSLFGAERPQRDSPRTRKANREPGRIGAVGSVLGGADTTLSAAEVQAIIAGAVEAVDNPNLVVAVVDRRGFPLALYRKAGGGANDPYDDLAVGLARTTAFFSNSRAPLSSRTVRFISGRNFPNGVVNTPAGGLYGVENTNRGCEVLGPVDAYNPGQAVTPSLSIAALRPASPLLCNTTVQNGCGTGIVTGKFAASSYVNPVDPLAFADERQDLDPTAVNPGGVPIFRINPSDPENRLLGGIGVSGLNVTPAEAEFAAFVGAASVVDTFPVFEFPLPTPGNVFIEGIRLPLVKQVTQPQGTNVDPGSFNLANFDPDFPPQAGAEAPIGYLIGPRADPNPGGLTQAQVIQIVRRAVDKSNQTRAQVRLPVGFCSRMIITVVNTTGDILAHYRMKDALFDAVDVVPAKARNAVYFSTPTGNAELNLTPPTAVSSRAIGYGGQPLFPSGILTGPPGPYFNPLYVNDVGDLVTKTGYCQQGQDASATPKNGVIFFAGSTPLYDSSGALIGGLGVSGDGLEQDDYVTFFGAGEFLPSTDIQINASLIDGVRIPYFKFPRNPEACDATRSPDPYRDGQCSLSFAGCSTVAPDCPALETCLPLP